LQHGVIDYVQSPSLPYAPGTRLSNDQLRKAGAELLNKINTVLNVSIEGVHTNTQTVKEPRCAVSSNATILKTANGGLLTIGCSTGGPAAVAILLAKLHKPFPVPIVIVQHIAAEFTTGFVSWLTEQTGMHTIGPLCSGRRALSFAMLLQTMALRLLRLKIVGVDIVESPIAAAHQAM
jgi:chemotaxis response regulator CheB